MFWDTAKYQKPVSLKVKPYNFEIIVVCAPTAQSKEKEIDKFEDSLDNANALCKTREITIVMGELNAKLRQVWEDRLIGDFGLGF